MFEIPVAFFDSFDGFEELGFVDVDKFLVVLVFFVEFEFEFVFEFEDNFISFLFRL